MDKLDTQRDNLRNRSLRSNFSWTFIGNGFYAACLWGVLSLIAKFGHPRMVGVYSLALALTAPIYMFTNLQLRSVQATDFGTRVEFSHYLTLRLFTSTSGMVVIFLIASFSSDNLKVFLVIILVGLSKFSESISDVIYGCFQREERMDYISISMAFRGATSVIITALSLKFFHSLPIVTAAIAFSWMVVLLTYDLGKVRQLTHVRFLPGKSALISLLKLSLPLGVVMMLISLNTNIPRYFIAHSLGYRALGYYSAVSYLSLMGMMVVNALGQSASPRLARHYSSGDVRAFQSLISKLVLIGMLLLAAGILTASVFGRSILVAVYNSQYSAYGRLLTLTMIAGGLGYISSFLGYGMTAARYFKGQPLIFIFVSGIISICSWKLVPRFGLDGAACALIVGNTVQLLGNSLVIGYLIIRLRRGREMSTHAV